MPRSVKIVIECDACGHEVKEGEGLSPILIIDGVGPRQLDFCERCYVDATIQNLVVLFDSATDMPKPKPATRSRGEQQHCGLCGASSPTAQGLGRHTKSAHDMTVAKMREVCRG